jgi:hypothetical protein
LLEWRNEIMGLNIEAELFSSKLSKPIDLRLTDGKSVEIDEGSGRTYFKGIEVSLYPQHVNGKIGYEDEVEGWMPIRFDFPVDVIVDVYTSNDLLYREFILSSGTEIPVDGNSAWIQIREVSEFYDRDRAQAERKRNGILELFDMDNSDATITISLSMTLAMW